MGTELATRTETGAGLPEKRNGSAAHLLSRRQKAAIVVRLLLAEGAKLPLSELPETLQAELTSQIASMKFVDRDTLREVIEEFASELDAIGLTFPGGLDGALKVLDGAINADLAARLRAQSGALWADDPWDAIAGVPTARLIEILRSESPEVGAVILSKLDIAKAAELLNKLPGPDARRLTLAVSETADVAPETVARIGVALAAEMSAEPPRAFTSAAAKRLGAILDVSSAPTREDVLAGLAEENAALAEEVRAAIFTFADIPERLEKRDIPGLARELDQEDLARAIAAAQADPALSDAATYILEGLPGRLAEAVREAAAEFEEVPTEEAEAAFISVVRGIRAMSDRGEIRLNERAAA